VVLEIAVTRAMGHV